MSDFTVLDIETTGKRPWDSDLLVVGVGTRAYGPTEGRAAARLLLARPGVVVCHTGFDLRWLALDGARVSDRVEFHDTRVMGWLLDENGSLALDDLCQKWLGFTPAKLLRQVANRVMFDSPSIGLVPIEEAPRHELRAYNESDLNATARLYERLRAELKAVGLWRLFVEDEVPRVRSIFAMETTGLPFDLDGCTQLREHVQAEQAELGVKLRRIAGLPDSFNFASTKQVGALLFTPKGQTFPIPDKLPMHDAWKSLAKAAGKGGKLAVVQDVAPPGFVVERVGRDWVHGHWESRGRGLKAAEHGFGSSTHWKEAATEHKAPSTNSISLVLSNPHDEWVAEFVLWRELNKLAGKGGSFLEKFPRYVNDGRLYGTINRTGTATGRFSSAEPNLQNIPAHGAYGGMVRALFRGDLVVGDYSQLEQRVAAHFSGDPNLLRAYREGIDLYGLAASTLFGGEPTKDHPQRGLMKTGMLALQYGAGAGKLAQLMLIDGHLDATKDGAKELIDQLQKVFPRFFAWREEVILRAIHDGFVQTLGGRRRHLEFPDGWARHRRSWGKGGLSQEECSAAFAVERQAVNAACQGGAADIVADAVVASMRSLDASEAVPLVQVHDEVLWQRGPAWSAASLERIRVACESGHGYELVVPLVFDAKEVGSWAEKGGGISNMSNLFSERMKRNRSEGLQSRKAADLARGRK